MKRSILTPRRILVGLTLLLLASSLMPVTVARSLSDKPRDFLVVLTAPPVAMLNRLGLALRRPSPPLTGGDNSVRLHQENQQFQVINAKLRDELARAQTVIEQLSGARRVFPLTGYRLLPAAVLDVAADPRRSSLMIEVGRRQGVSEGMVVVKGAHLVGVVTDTTPMTSSVTLLDAPSSTVQVEITAGSVAESSRRYTALIRRDNEGKGFVVQVGRDKVIEVGDTARLTDRRFPKEAHFFVVGTVTEVSEDTQAPFPSLYRMVRIAPVIAISRQTHVAVVVPKQADENNE